MRLRVAKKVLSKRYHLRGQGPGLTQLLMHLRWATVRRASKRKRRWRRRHAGLAALRFVWSDSSTTSVWLGQSSTTSTTL